jgi:DNA-binding response OmpR family regulator
MRLLIVEDDLDGRELLTELFRAQDWTVSAVPTASAGLRALRSGAFDVIISDENLEGESGSRMLRQASAEGLLCQVRTLMYTAAPGELDVPLGTLVLRKPLGVARILREAQAMAPRVSSRAPR